MTGKQAQEWIKPALYIGGGFLAWRHVISPLLETVGLKDSAEDKLRQSVESRPSNYDYWRPGFWQQYPSQMPVKGGVKVILLSQAAADSFVKTLNDAQQPYYNYTGTTYGTDEEKIFGVFRALKYKTQVSFLADQYYKKYHSDLYQDLKGELLESELNTLLQITEKLLWGIQLSNGQIK